MSTDKTMPPWATGPAEVLQHGMALLDDDTDAHRRLAMISIDNAVELMMKTYISLPRRITGLKLTRKELDEIGQKFPTLLDGMETHAADKIIGINLGEVEYYHRIRNDLYHQGSGLTVERKKVLAYSQIAIILFANLFGVTLPPVHGRSAALFGRFMEAWIQLEGYEKKGRLIGKCMPPSTSMMHEYEELRQVRNQVIHGLVDPKTVISDDVIKRVMTLAEKVKRT